MCYTKTPHNILLQCLPNVHCQVNQSLQSNIVLCLKSWAVTSPVLAGFLLVISSTAGCFQRSWVRLLQVLFIQKCVRVHQILKTGRKQGEREGLVKPSYRLMSLYGRSKHPLLTTSSSFMSLADSAHILTVLGSRAAFSAATTDVGKCYNVM